MCVCVCVYVCMYVCVCLSVTDCDHASCGSCSQLCSEMCVCMCVFDRLRLTVLSAGLAVSYGTAQM